MPTTLLPYGRLPAAVRSKIEQEIGAVLFSTSATEGLDDTVAATVHSSSGDYFVRALRIGHSWAWNQQRETDNVPSIHTVAPSLTAHIVTGGWDVYIYSAAPGRHADYRPGSPDIPAVLGLIERIAQIPATDLPLRDVAHHLTTYVNDPDDLQLFAGRTLLRTDWNPARVIMNGEAQLMGCSWTTRGAQWLDAAYWITWLIAAGHTAAEAEAWARRSCTWRTATEKAITAFADANARRWADFASERSDQSIQRLASASRGWQRARKGDH